MPLRDRISSFFDIIDGKKPIVKERPSLPVPADEKAIGAGWNSVATVLPPGDTFVHFLSLASEEDYPQYIRIRDPYLDNAWVFSATQVMAENLAQVPFVLKIGDQEIEEKGQYFWLWKLFNDVGPYLNRFALFESIPIWLSLRGECFWQIIRDNLTGRQPGRIRILEPDYLREIVRDGEIVQWAYEPAGKGKVFIDATDIIQFKYYNPYNRYRGMPPLVASALGLHVDYSATAFNYYFFNNQATPGGVLVTKSETITDQEKDAIELRWKKKHRGLKRAGIMGILSHGADYKPISLAQKDIEYAFQKKWSRAEVFAVLNVPQALCHVLEDSSIKSNVREQKAQLFENNLIPKIKLIQDVLRTDFFSREKLTGITGTFDLDSVEALHDSITDKINNGLKLFRLGFTANEINKRLKLGFEDQPWRDKWWTGINMMPVGDDGTQAIQQQQRTPQPQKSIDARYIENKRVWQNIIRKIDPIEREYAKKLQDYFYKIRQDVLGRILGEKSVKAIDPIDLNMFLFTSEFDSLIDEISRGSFTDAYQIGIDSVGIETTYSMTNIRAVTSLSKRIESIKEINETVRSQLLGNMKPALQEGLKEGLSYDAISAKLAEAARGVLNNAKNRVRTIARTEINGAMNQARFDTMKESGIKKHQWTTSLDTKVRDTHFLLEGQIRSIDEIFDNGLMYPHDPNGDLAEVINCRCIAVPVTETEE